MTAKFSSIYRIFIKRYLPDTPEVQGQSTMEETFVFANSVAEANELGEQYCEYYWDDKYEFYEISGVLEVLTAFTGIDYSDLEPDTIEEIDVQEGYLVN